MWFGLPESHRINFTDQKSIPLFISFLLLPFSFIAFLLLFSPHPWSVVLGRPTKWRKHVGIRVGEILGGSVQFPPGLLHPSSPPSQTTKTVVLKVGSLNKPAWTLPGDLIEILGLHLRLRLCGKFWEWDLAMCLLTSPPSDSDVW